MSVGARILKWQHLRAYPYPPPEVHSQSRTYGEVGNEYFTAICEDTSYIYAVGYTNSEGQGGDDCLLVKFNKTDLSIAKRKVLGGLYDDEFYGVCVDDSYVYAVGDTWVPSRGRYDCLVVKFKKDDLSIIDQKAGGGPGNAIFYGVCEDADCIYAVGATDSEGQGATDWLIVKLNKADLSIAQRKVYGGTQNENAFGVCVDDSYIYVVGYTGSEGQGLNDCLIVKYNKVDLSTAERKVYGGLGEDYFNAVCEDTDYVYAVGATSSEGQGGYDCLIVKFNKADLSIAERKVYGGLGDDWFEGVGQDPAYIYAVGYTNSEGQGGYDCLIVKFNKADLSIAQRIVYGGIGDEWFYGGCDDEAYIYCAGSTNTKAAGGYDCFILKCPNILRTGNSVPAGFVSKHSALTLADSAQILGNSALWQANSMLVLADSALTLADSALILSEPYVI